MVSWWGLGDYGAGFNELDGSRIQTFIQVHLDWFADTLTRNKVGPELVGDQSDSILNSIQSPSWTLDK